VNQRSEGAPRKRTPSNYEIEKGLRKSLESTDEGLKKFLASVRQSGLAGAHTGYRALQVVLVQQRLWARSHHRESLTPLFRSIAKTAGELHDIFASFADVMRPLRDLDKIDAATATISAPRGAAEVAQDEGSSEDAER
jgi:hypothetical protein